jgi:hypothetical protein
MMHEPECRGRQSCICEQLRAAYSRGYLSALLEARESLAEPDPAGAINEMLADLAHP